MGSRNGDGLHREVGRFVAIRDVSKADEAKKLKAPIGETVHEVAALRLNPASIRAPSNQISKFLSVRQRRMFDVISLSEVLGISKMPS